MEFTRYTDKKFIVFPVDINKAPAIPKEVVSWSDIEDSSDYIEWFKNDNIGIVTGSKNNIVVIDIDEEDVEIKEQIEIILEDYPTPVKRLGKRTRLPSRFYSYNGEASENIKNPMTGKNSVEILSNGRYCVLPPSMRADGLKFEWVGKSILDIPSGHLPTIDMEMIQRIRDLYSHLAIKRGITKTTRGVTQSDGKRCNHGSHDLLSAMLVAGIHAGDTPNVILNNLLEHDERINPDISYFICPSRSEWRTKERVVNALKFVTQGFENQAKKGLVSDIKATESVINIVEGENAIIEPELKREKLPRLLGIGQRMFEYMYSMSTTPKSHQVLSYIMSLSSVLMSNRYQLEGTFSNTFTLVFSESGGGKNEGQDFITALLEQSGMNGLIGERLAGGSTAMIMNLPDFRERIDIVSEGTRFFEAIGSNKEYKSEMALIYSDLFNAGGKGFYNKSNQQEKKDNKGNKQGRIGECFSPCITLLVTINMSSSKMLIKNKMYEQGFMARLNVRLDSDRKKRKPYGGSVVDNIPYEFISFIKSAGPIKKVMENKGVGMDLNTPEPLKKFIVPEIPVDEDAMKRIKEIEQEIIEMEYSIKSDDMMLFVIRRTYENFKKNILCITPLSLSRLTDLRVSIKEVEWAWSLSKTDLHNHRLYLRQEMVDSKKELLMTKIFKLVKQSKKLAKSDVCRKIRGDKREREEAIADLKECGYIQEFHENKICFYSVLKNLEL